MMNRLMVFLKYPEKKHVFQIIKEVLTLVVKKREIPFYYFKYLYRKKVTNYLDYVSTGELNRIGTNKTLHKPEYFPIIENKLFFAFFCEKVSLKTPKLISYNLGSTFFFNQTVQIINNKEELKVFFEMVFRTSNDKALFFRPPSEYGGKGCFKLEKANLIDEINTYYDLLINGCFTHTKIILQHKDLSKIHSKSVNTMRLITFITDDKSVEIIGGFLRFGVGESVVDNASSGGFFVGINLKTGTLQKTGHYLPEYGGEEINKHPDSGFVFNDFKIPYFKEACDMVRDAVNLIPDRFIGWDIAITQEGPLIVEANTQPHIPISDIVSGGLLRNPLIKKLVEDLNNNKI